MNNVQRQRELAERIADDERHAAAVRKAAEYDALAARLEVLEAAFDNSHKLNEQLGDENRALLARAEAAEAAETEAVDLHRQLAEMAAAMEEIEAERLALAARVAELEAQLAAQGWQPVTEKPTADDEYLVWCSSYEGGEIQSYSRRFNRWYSNTGNDADYWRPLPPPAPQEAE